MRWLDTERYQAACLGMDLSNLHRSSESIFVMNMVVGSQHQQNRVGAIGGRFQRGQGDGWRSVASQRLENDATAAHLRHTQLLGDDEAVVFVADHYCRRVLQTLEPSQRALKHGSLILAIKGKKLLRETLSR